MVCPGNAASESHEGLLLLKNATVNRNLGFDDVCKAKHAYVAYINEVSNITGDMVEYQLAPYISYWNIAFEWEIQAAFFASYNIKPHWINANYTWGSLNSTTGQWSGAIGMIQRDEADYAIFGFAGTYGISMVAAFTPGASYGAYYWLTRYPKELSPTWNLFRLFTKEYFTNKIY